MVFFFFYKKTWCLLCSSIQKCFKLYLFFLWASYLALICWNACNRCKLCCFFWESLRHPQLRRTLIFFSNRMPGYFLYHLHADSFEQIVCWFFLYILMFSNYLSQSAGDASQGLKFSRRIASLERFREKRKERCFEKKVRYTCRKEVAQR